MSPDAYDLPTMYLNSPESLAGALSHWFEANLLAVDIECSLTGVHHCALALVQIATHDQAWILDPLALSEFMPGALRAMAEVPWIVHDFSGDGVVFKRLYDLTPESVLDTMMLARALGYPQPSLKTLSKLKLGLDIPKEEQDSNWMLRPLRESQIRYAARDATLLLPLLRILAREAEERRAEPGVAEALARLPQEMLHLKQRLAHYRVPASSPVADKARRMGLDDLAVARAQRLSDLRNLWGNAGDVAAVMELGNRWILARVQRPPASPEALAACIPNPRFRRRHLDELWGLFDGNHLPGGAVDESMNPHNFREA